MPYSVVTSVTKTAERVAGVLFAGCRYKDSRIEGRADGRILDVAIPFTGSQEVGSSDDSLTHIFDQTPPKAPNSDSLEGDTLYPDRSPFATDRASRACRRVASCSSCSGSQGVHDQLLQNPARTPICFQVRNLGYW